MTKAMRSSAEADGSEQPIQPLRPVRKPSSYRDLGPVDIAALVPLGARISEDTWNAEDARKENDFAVFHHTRHLVFRFTPRNLNPLDFYSTQAWDVWSPILLPIMHQAIEDYAFVSPEFPKVMLARLAAGHVIDPHRDGAGSNLLTHKIHVPVQTNPGAIFSSAGEERHLALGHAYEVNNIARHSVRNEGAQDRIHLVFEVFESEPQTGGRGISR